MPPGLMIGWPPCSTIRSKRSNVSVFGLLLFPKNSTQKAGSNEKEAKELVC